jgi:hypothetical protein
MQPYNCTVARLPQRGPVSCTSGVFSWSQTSPRRSFSLRWAVFWAWGYVRSCGRSWRHYGTSQFWSWIGCPRTQTLSYCKDFCTSAPAKILFVGLNALLTTLFQGGIQEFPEEEWVGLAPKMDDELGLAVGVEDAPPSLAGQIQVIKGDTQKADSANVPEHLWVYAFLCGYGPGAHGPCHLRALGLPPTASVGGLSNPSPPEGWESTFSGLSTLALFRLLGLSCWRQQVLRGFFAWRKSNIWITKGCSPGQMVHPVLVTRRTG